MVCSVLPRAAVVIRWLFLSEFTGGPSTDYKRASFAFLHQHKTWAICLVVEQDSASPNVSHAGILVDTLRLNL